VSKGENSSDRSIYQALVGTRGPNGLEVAVGAEGFDAAAMRDAGHRSLDGNGGCCCDIDIVRDLRMGDGDAGVVERYDVKPGVADRWEVEGKPGVEIRGGAIDAERVGDMGATDAERVGFTDVERLWPKRERGEAMLEI
jgi:hypothetical protein